MKSNAKAKSTVSVPRKKKTQAKAAPTAKKEVSAKVVKQRSEEFWKQELDALSKQEFRSLDDAIQTLIRGVISRLKVETHKKEETGNFLRQMIDDDPILQDLIKGNFNIKS